MTLPVPGPSNPQSHRIRLLRIAVPLILLLFFTGAILLQSNQNLKFLAFVPATLEPTPTATATVAPTRSPNAISPLSAGNTLTATETITPTSLPNASSTPRLVINLVTPPPSATPTAVPRPRIFVATERQNIVQVFEDDPPRLVTAIPVGTFPHNISVSNDGHYIGVDDRYSDQISILDTQTLTEVVRIQVGRQPHDLSWSPDDSRIYVTQERAPFISVIDTLTWKTLAPIQLDSPTHDLTLSPDGRFFWATTIAYRGLVIVDTRTGQVVDRLAYFPHGSHDAYFTPDGSEVWVTSSGFIENASQIDPYVVVFDAATHKIKMIQPMGLYPFHSVKRYRDGLFLPPNSPVMWFSDREAGGVIEVSVQTHQVLASLKTGRAPFHLSYGPNGLLYVANHDDATFSVIDPVKLEVLETIHTAPDPHGIVIVAAP